MSTKALAKMYDRLTPWERVPLLIAADARDDAAELDRLQRAAPRRVCEAPDHADLMDALHWLAATQVMSQLDLALAYGRVSALSDEHFWSHEGGEDDPLGSRLETLERLLAYQFVVNADAWRRFCGDLAIDPDALLAGYPGCRTLKRTEEMARLVACTSEEAAADTRRQDPEAKVPTVECTAKAMREALDRLVES
jgi:hypothetical protein